MKKTLFLLPLLTMLFWQSSANANSDGQLAAIGNLGKLNGVALQCRYLDQMRRIKQVLVLNLPKKRELGLHFEQTTNASFLAFMNEQSDCPDVSAFVSQIDDAVTELETAFKR